MMVRCSWFAIVVWNFAGNSFVKNESFGQFPLQVEGFKDIHESLEAAMAQGEIETLTDDNTIKSGQEVTSSRKSRDFFGYSSE